MTELIKKGKILDKIYTIVGDEGTDIILNSKGNVKIRFGNSFLNLIKNGKISSEAISGYSSSGIKEVGDKSEIVSDGIYFSKADKTFYISFGGIIFEINGKEVEDEEDIPGEGDNIDYTSEDYLAISKKQKLTSEQIKYALGNLKQVIEYLVDDSDDLPLDYAYYVVDNKRHYVKTNEGLQELYLNLNDGGIVKGTVSIGETNLDYQKSKLNIISKSPITLFDGDENSLKIEFNDNSIVLIPNNSSTTKYVINTTGIGVNTVPTNALEIAGNELINGILQVLYPGRIITEDIGSNIFIPGFTGEGFRIYRDEQGRYIAEFDNLTVRQTMRIYELILEKIRVVKGALIISQGGSKIKAIEEIELETFELDENYQFIKDKPITVECYQITFDDEYIPFSRNDLARCQVFQYPDVRGYWVWIREVDGNSIYVDKTEFAEPYNIPQIGDEVCQLGNVIDPNRQSAIYLSASDTVNPIIDILSDIKQKSFNGSVRCRLGNLKGITYGKSKLEGYGLFGDNVYLKGKLITFGHDSNNWVDVGNFYESNCVNLSQTQLLKEFLTDTFKQLIFYNGDYIPGEERFINNPEYKTPIMKYPYNDSNPPDLDAPRYDFNPKDPDNPLEIKVELNPPEASYGSIYNCTKEGITTYYLRDYEDPSDPSTPLIWRSITEYHNPKPDPLPEDFIDIDLLPIETDLCKQLNLLGTNNTLYYSEYENLPSTPYNLDDYWITTYNKIYLSLADRKSSETSILDDWAERNLAQSSIREDVANKLGYDNYQDLMTWALKGNTIIEGGYINTRLLEAEIIIGNQLIEGPYMRSDKIEIRDPNNSNVTRWRLNAEAITGGIELVESSSIDGVTTIVERPHVKFLPDGTMYGLRRSNENDNPWRFNSDGSGSLAYNNIYWDTNGKITFGDPTNGTTIDMGLITTGTIALGSGENMFIPNSGITGSNTQTGLTGDNLVRFWAGGTLDAARNTVLNDINGTSNVPTAPFVVTQGGKMYASNASIEGVINVGVGGSIGNMTIEEDYFQLIGPDLTFAYKACLRIGQNNLGSWGLTLGKYYTPNNSFVDPCAYIAFNNSDKNPYIKFEKADITSLYAITAKIRCPILTEKQGETFYTDGPLSIGSWCYYEVGTDGEKDYKISLSGGELGQIICIYNRNQNHRFTIPKGNINANHDFWFVEDTACLFIKTSNGWKLLEYNADWN